MNKMPNFSAKNNKPHDVNVPYNDPIPISKLLPDDFVYNLYSISISLANTHDKIGAYNN